MTETQELTIAERASRALSIEHTETELKELAGKYRDVTEIKDRTDYDLVKGAHLELGRVRISIREAGKAARDDANKFQKAVIAEEKRLISIIGPEETRLKALRQDVDDAEARKAEEARQIEQRRIFDITERIQAIKRQTDGLLNADAIEIQMRIDAIASIVCNAVVFGEFSEQAANVRAEALESLQQALDARKTLEAQQAEAARIAEEQARQQAQIAEQQAEIKRQQDELDRQKREAEEAKLAEERAAAAKVQAEKEALERAKAEADEQERKRKEAEAEIIRQEALRPDKDKLLAWAAELRFMEGPKVSDPACEQIRQDAMRMIGNASNLIISTVKSL